MKRIRLLEIAALNMYWVGLSFMWTSLHVILLPAVLLLYVPETQKNSYLGLLTFAGLVIAMLVQPISGALSDRWRSRWGRRRPLVLLGTLFDFVFLALLGWAGGLLWLFVGYIGLQFSSNIAHGPAQGLLPDKVPPEQYGRASGVKNLMDMAGLIAASLLMGRIVDAEAANIDSAIAVVMVVLAGGAAVTLAGTRERSTVEISPTPRSPQKKAPWLPDLKANPGYWWLIASRFFFLLAVYDIQAFAQYYVRDVLKAPSPLQLTGDLMAAITVSLVLFSLAGGWLGDRIGHRSTLLLASGVSAVGCLLLLLARSPVSLLAFGSILGAGVGLFLTSNWATATQLAPAMETGKFLGFTNLATAGSGAVGRLMGPVIDALNNAQPGAYWGYSALFLFGAACAVASGLLVLKALPSRSASTVTTRADMSARSILPDHTQDPPA